MAQDRGTGRVCRCERLLRLVRRRLPSLVRCHPPDADRRQPRGGQSADRLPRIRRLALDAGRSGEVRRAHRQRLQGGEGRGGAGDGWGAGWGAAGVRVPPGGGRLNGAGGHHRLQLASEQTHTRTQTLTPTHALTSGASGGVEVNPGPPVRRTDVPDVRHPSIDASALAPSSSAVLCSTALSPLSLHLLLTSILALPPSLCWQEGPHPVQDGSTAHALLHQRSAVTASPLSLSTQPLYALAHTAHRRVAPTGAQSSARSTEAAAAAQGGLAVEGPEVATPAGCREGERRSARQWGGRSGKRRGVGPSVEGPTSEVVLASAGSSSPPFAPPCTAPLE